VADRVRRRLTARPQELLSGVLALCDDIDIRDFGPMDAEGRLRPGVDPKQATIDLIALTDGVQLQWLLRHSVDHMGESVRRYLESVTTLEF
jgi:hypothetical protein